MSKKIKSLFETKKQFFYTKCNKENCNKPGIYKAPESPDNLKTYILCVQERVCRCTVCTTLCALVIYSNWGNVPSDVLPIINKHIN